MQPTVIGVAALSVLAGGAHYAEAVITAVARASGGQLRIHRSSMHYLMRRFVRQKVVTTHRRMASNGRRREVLWHYQLTERGEVLLERYRALFTVLWATLPAETRLKLKRVAGL